MKIEMLKNILNQIAEISHQTRNYIKSGSLHIAIAPYLMHPCVTKTSQFFVKFIAILTAFTGVFYLFGEHISILFSERSITAYFHHSTLELMQPIGTMIDGKESKLSTMPQVLSAVFVLQSYIFLLVYIFGIYPISEKRYWILGGFFALCFSIGAMLTSSTSGGKYTIGGLQNFGTSLTFIFGNLTLIISGLDLKNPKIKFFKKYSITAGLIGVGAILFTLFMPTIFSPLIERLGIYTIMIWEILAGFAIIYAYRK